MATVTRTSSPGQLPPPTESEQQALGLLVRDPRIARAKLAQRLDISPQAVSQVINRLSARGVPIAENDVPTGRGGQAARVYELKVPADVVAIGVDIGYHETSVALCGLLGAPVGAAETIGDGLLQTDPSVVLDAATTAIAQQLVGRRSEDVVGVGIAVAAPVDGEKGMLRSGSRPGRWEVTDIAKELAARFPAYDGWRYSVDNDANLAAIAERRIGVARDHDSVVYVRWTAGIGTGLVLDGRPYKGTTGIAGELGHIVLPLKSAGESEPAPCPWCGQLCLQARAGADAILSASDVGGDQAELAIRDVIRLADHNADVKEAIARAAGYLGKALAIVVDLLNPELIVIGGAFGRNDYSLVVPALQSSMAESTIQPAFRDVRIVMGDYGGGDSHDAVIRGATIRVFDEHLSSFLLAR